MLFRSNEQKPPLGRPPGRDILPQKTPWLTQKFWRRAALGCLAAAGLMAWYGAMIMDPRQHWMFLAGYWGLFLLLLLATLYAVVLDIRFIRLKYALGARAIYEETVGDPAFREAMRKALEEERRSKPAPPRPPDRGNGGQTP